MERYTPKILCLVILFICESVDNRAYSQGVDSVELANNTYWEAQLHNEMEQQLYDEAYATIDSINFNYSVSNVTLLDITYCMIHLRKYDECIRFCNWYIDSNGIDGDFQSSLFENSRGECYYYKEDYQSAKPFLSRYITSCDEKGKDPGSYYLSMYAHTLSKLHEYSDASKMYDRWLKQILEEDNLTLETLSHSKYRESYGYHLYGYAYNYFFLGNEADGARMLKLAMDCGNEAAIADNNILTTCASFNREIKYKNSTIREFEKTLASYDIPRDSLQSDGLVDANYFWYCLQQCSEEYQKLEEALRKAKKPSTLERAQKYYRDNRESIDKYLSQCSPYAVSDVELQLDSTICGPTTFLEELRIYPSEQANAFATPYGNMYLTDAIVMRMHFNKDLLTGVCAHEAAHYLLQHSLVCLWNKEKKDKKNKILGGVVAGLTAAAEVGSTLYAASNGVQFDQSYYDDLGQTIGTQIDNIMYSFDKNTYYFQFKYGRSQELESDLAAYRFCEAMGIGGYAYIMSLQLLGYNDGYMKAEKESDHPAMAYRIGLLKYLFAKEHKSE